MIQQEKFNRRLALEASVAPGTLYPAGLGLAGLTFSAVVGTVTGVVPFLSVLALLGGVATFGIRMITGGGRLREKVQRKLQQEAEERLMRDLDELEQQLRSDAPRGRAHALLTRLRSVMKDMRHEKMWVGVTSDDLADIMATVDKLFALCVETLRKSRILQHDVGEAATDAVQRKIEATAEALLTDVGKNVSTIEGLVADIVGMRALTPDADGAVLRAQLAERLNIARNVNAWVHSEGQAPSLASDSGPDSVIEQAEHPIDNPKETA